MPRLDAVPSEDAVGRSPDVAVSAASVRLDGAWHERGASRSLVASNPRAELRILGDGRLSRDGGAAIHGDVLATIDGFLERQALAGRTVIGALGFELRRWTEPRSEIRVRSTPLPVAVLLAFDAVAIVDDPSSSRGDDDAERTSSEVRVAGLRARTDRAAYTERFGRLQRWIAAGDVYQVNLAIAFEAHFAGDPGILYERLRRRNPTPFAAYLDLGGFQLVSNSPELFLAKRGDTIVTRPIKGTRRRGTTPPDDARLAAELRRDPKERAEHLMIVDLERNDLGRIAEIGSVAVPEFENLETYATLHHLESLVSARLRPGVRFSDVLRATFPGGSISGAPKVRALQILEELEGEARGYYTGAILLHPPDGDFTVSLAIRTATVAGGRIEYRAGGGVVADSVADAEYDECLLKSAAFFDACRDSTSRRGCPSST